MFGGLARLLVAFGTSSVDIYEWAEADVRKRRLSKGPVWSNLATPQPALLFNGWQLAHAVIKTDYLVERDWLLPGLGFLLQIDRIVDFGAGHNLRLVTGSPASLNDFTRTSLAGRVGQGLSLLFAQREGYAFVCHLASDPQVVAHIAALPKKAKKRAADFLFENQKLERMILESKASFTQADNKPSPIKSTLKDALTGQVDYWMSRIAPAAQKGFAVYSCLRESGNPVPSALIFVDPPRQLVRQPIDFPEGLVRRHNYAAWLSLMGLRQTATNLISFERRDRTEVELPVIQIGKRKFAVSAHSSTEKIHRWVCTGLDVEVVATIGAALDGDDGPLLAFGQDLSESIPRSVDGVDYGSIFPDGSYFGLFDERSPFHRFQGYERFSL
jgi:hypothetical protein